ncbi:uncharacterized protein MELLADRAFT_88565 [Melampsora larici-populina 98AG31]|uniref:Uncharacterized protein n=1 Tax=Melampsora larici-populina (strain 98AG31 / pathotype 3-4-7) TaxID=747676 RepID=F4RS75_MELLP|nr:uncharacterized protein MELLADRAFT_88565 [Melampsora larici-populina 98AG31]EGG04828.1 hypothetical protein MELLADRAFT_88565 [Melampsora larici-populina 98AG31]
MYPPIHLRHMYRQAGTYTLPPTQTPAVHPRRTHPPVDHHTIPLRTHPPVVDRTSPPQNAPTS